jgi:hypothetical protein
MFEEESDKTGDTITKFLFFSFCFILIITSISILYSFVIVNTELLIMEILSKIILSAAFLISGLGLFRFFRRRNKKIDEEEFWETLRQSSTDC